jgi:hypothetical protein
MTSSPKLNPGKSVCADSENQKIQHSATTHPRTGKPLLKTLMQQALIKKGSIEVMGSTKIAQP